MAHIKSYILLLVLVIAGCTPVNEYSKMDQFEQTSNGYEVSIRWSDFDMAASFVKDKEDPKLAAQLENLKQFSVTDYNVKTFVPSEDKNRVLIVSEVQYFKKNGLIIKTYSHRQIWEYDQEKERWFLTSGLPELE